MSARRKWTDEFECNTLLQMKTRTPNEPDQGSGGSPQRHVVVAVYHSDSAAEHAIEKLARAGFDLRKLSILDHRKGGDCDRWGHRCVALFRSGIPVSRDPESNIALDVDQSVLIAQWSGEEVTNGCEEIHRTHPESIEEHLFPSAEPELASRG